MYLKRQKFVVFGLSKSGIAASEFLLSQGAKVYLYEELESPKISENINSLVSKGCEVISKGDIERVASVADVLVLSPGVPVNHSVAVECRKQGKRIIGEFELGSLYLKNPVIAITGTNGKTTTCNIVGEILNQAHIRNVLAGNIGSPLTAELEKIEDKTVIAEVSSFQLETVNAFIPHIACVLNIAPDHLDRHYTMDNYIFLKKRLLKNLRESEYAVLNYDDEVVRSFAENCKAKIIWFSTKEAVFGAYSEGNAIYYNGDYVCDFSVVNMIGAHSAENVLAAIAIGFLIGADKQSIITALSSFKGVRHRNEFVKNVDGINFYNDSKGTNTAAALSAAQSMKVPTVMILGGKDKGEDYTPFFEKLKSTAVTCVVLVGESRYKMLQCAVDADYKNVTLTGSLKDAVKIAKMLAEKGGNVLLSPATSSFDTFGSFEERGEYFCQAVEKLDADKEE